MTRSARRPFDAGWRARVSAAGVTAAVLASALASLAGPPADAAVRTATKTTKKSATASNKTTNTTVAANGTVSAVTATTKPVPTTTLPPRKAGQPLKGFGLLTEADWPATGDAVIAASIARTIEVLRAPNDRTGALRFDEGRSVYGPLRFLAMGVDGDWVRVAIPVRPNGTVGWVRAADVRLQRTFLHISIELQTNTMRVYDGDKVVVETKVGAGTGGTPTPTGLFFVKEVVPQANPGGALGPIALGLSGFSTVLQTFAGGSGTIAIHGTNAPGKLGGDVSHGCVRVANDVITKVASMVPLGTPVEISERFSDVPSARQTSSWVDAFNAGVRSAGSSGAVSAAAATANTLTPVVAAATSPVVADPTTSAPTTAPAVASTTTTPA